jgi:hypothetical protein
MSGFGEHVDRVVYLSRVGHAELIATLTDLDLATFERVFADYPAWRASRPAPPPRRPVDAHPEGPAGPVGYALIDPSTMDALRHIPARPRPRQPLRRTQR